MNKYKTIIEYNKEIEDIEGLLYQLKQERANLSCPFLVGETIVRYEGQEYVISRITPKDWEPFFSLYGYRTKKDGILYKIEHNLSYNIEDFHKK